MPLALNCATQNSTDALASVGLSLDRAHQLAAQRNESIRVVQQDGVWNAVTADAVPNRVDVAVSAGIITRACLE